MRLDQRQCCCGALLAALVLLLLAGFADVSAAQSPPAAMAEYHRQLEAYSAARGKYDLLAAMQLFDDIRDAEEDAASGQPNAVLAAGDVARVRAAALELLEPLAHQTGGLGAFARSIIASRRRADRLIAVAAVLHEVLARNAEAARPA